MKSYEIERKYLISQLPEQLEQYPFHEIEQGYLCTEPVVRIRREDDTYYLTYKSKGLMIREEANLPLTKEAYEHLRTKADGHLISKRRYLIPFASYTIELDVFRTPRPDLILAEVEFSTKEEAMNFMPPSWFGEEVTNSPLYQNSQLSVL